MNNPLIRAVNAYEDSICAGIDMMGEIGGAECLDNFDQELSDAVLKLTRSASEAVRKLSPRAREARLNLLWREFVAKHRAAKEITKG